MSTNLSDLTWSLNLVFGPYPRFRRGRLPRAIAMTDMARTPDPKKLLLGLPFGSAIILRHPDVETLIQQARDALPLAKKLGHRVLIAGNPRVAFNVGADGVHLPEALINRKPNTYWAKFHPQWIITASAHKFKTIRNAQLAGADAVILSPVLTTTSHPGERPLCFLRFSKLCRSSKLAVYALGGISQYNIPRLKGSGCAGIAGIQAFLGD